MGGGHWISLVFSDAHGGSLGRTGDQGCAQVCTSVHGDASWGVRRGEGETPIGVGVRVGALRNPKRGYKSDYSGYSLRAQSPSGPFTRLLCERVTAGRIAVRFDETER